MDKIGVILAGGGGRRMGGTDKALLRVHEHRLIDRVYQMLNSQVDVILVSGRQAYGLDVAFVPDIEGTIPGPVGGIFSIARFIVETYPQIPEFVTVPVDCPAFPVDLVDRLHEMKPAIASDEAGTHPTFACWNTQDVISTAQTTEDGASVSLRAFAAACEMNDVFWAGNDRFLNINTPAELAAISDRFRS